MQKYEPIEEMTMSNTEQPTQTDLNEPDYPERIRVPIRVGSAGQKPLYASTDAAGCDLFAACALVLRPGETSLLPLDLVIALAPGVEAQIRPRSGLSLKTSLRLPNSPGTIDSDYRNEVAVLLQNTFSLADLPGLILARPQVLEELATSFRRLTLADYLRQQTEVPQQPADGQPQVEGQQQQAENLRKPKDFAKYLDEYPDIANQTVYVDEQGNPYGTLYIQPGERIAQMVFSRCLQAAFVDHPEPESIGRDRGGGFGSTGTR